MGTHVCISAETKGMLDEFAAEAGLHTADEAIHYLIAFKRDAQFWEQCDRGYRALRGDPDAWAAEQAERVLWDNTLSDGLEDA